LLDLEARIVHQGRDATEFGHRPVDDPPGVCRARNIPPDPDDAFLHILRTWPPPTADDFRAVRHEALDDGTPDASAATRNDRDGSFTPRHVDASRLGEPPFRRDGQTDFAIG